MTPSGKEVIAQLDELLTKLNAFLATLRDENLQLDNLDENTKKIVDLRFKVIKETLWLTENSFADLQDALDTLEYQEDPDIDTARNRVRELEDVVGECIERLRALGRY